MKYLRNVCTNVGDHRSVFDTSTYICTHGSAATAVHTYVHTYVGQDVSLQMYVHTYVHSLGHIHICIRSSEVVRAPLLLSLLYCTHVLPCFLLPVMVHSVTGEGGNSPSVDVTDSVALSTAAQGEESGHAITQDLRMVWDRCMRACMRACVRV